MLLWSSLVACTAPSPTDPPAESLVETASKQGVHPVGHTRIEVTTGRLGTTEDRVFPVEVWYPASTASSSATAYTVAGLASVPSLHATENAESIAGSLPVAVYSHGSGGVGALGYPYAERLASHGWIVIAPDHVGNTTLDFLGSGDSFARSALDRPLDIQASLDALETGPAGLDGDTSAVLLFGHSFGGYTSFAVAGASLDAANLVGACPADSDDPDCVLLRQPEVVQAIESDAFADSRITTIVPQAPAVFGFTATALAELEVPVLLMSGARDLTTPDAGNAGRAWEELDGSEDRWLQLPEGGHHSFITTCDDVGVELVETFVANARQDGCGADNVPIAEAVPAMATLLLGWGGVHVLGEPAWTEVLDAELHAGLQMRVR